MSIYIKCKCASSCTSSITICMDEDTYINTVAIEDFDARHVVLLSRQDLIDIHDAIDVEINKPLPNIFRKMYGMNHVQLKLPGMENTK